ncbi:MAG TPA: hypothetical protein VLL54_11850 [Pyrinomonadaceae bacterium]|nr:hypothetical protein [Pyrinomonadaceae bacterium]
MLTIRKANSEDFERVYPLLESFGESPIAKETWRKIFVTPWHTDEDFCGYVLLNDDEVKGYLGLVFSQRISHERNEKFCNMTSWIVTEDSRSKSLAMVLKALELKDYTFTNFTASPTVAQILVKLGFTEFAVDQLVLLPVPRSGMSGVEFSLDDIGENLDGEDRRIFDDHQGLNCRHLLLQSAKGKCYVLLKNTTRKRLPFAKVHYLSNVDVFHECIESLVAGICLRLRVFGLMVDERYLAGRTFRGARPYPHQRKAYFKSSSILDEKTIDTIYSELVLLHN